MIACLLARLKRLRLGVEYEKHRAQYRENPGERHNGAYYAQTADAIYGDCMIVFCYKDKTKTKIEQVQKCQNSAEVG